MGLTKDSALPDFSAMYSGTPDSAWFVRREMGHTMEFSDGELILVVESDASTAKPVVRLSVVPLKTDQVAKSIQYRSVRFRKNNLKMFSKREKERSKVYQPISHNFFRLQGKAVPDQISRRGREGDKSVMALSSSSASSQCFCPCMGSGLSSPHCLAR